ncbi:MAG: DNA polymerase/3'-5' exonuclease PolX [Methanomassiliicoccales archaeon]|jgi:DNA polymerase (family 10)|nr:DNA polymerase/3'-5' exonuclease PolX [Methanomassiliicoccales archaeon]
MSNAKIAAILYEIADLLELKGVEFKPRAYRKAARNIETLGKDITEYYKEGKLEEIPGVGKAIAKKIREIIETGELNYLKQLREELPAGLLQLMEIPEIGPKTAMRLYKELKITNLHELKKAAEEHRIRRLKGFGEKSEENILKGIRIIEQRSGRMLLGYAYYYGKKIEQYIASVTKLRTVSVAGSLRRMKETIGDIDILVGSDNPSMVMDVFVSNPEVEEVLARGDTRGSVRLKDGVQVDIRVVSVDSYGAALQYFTGSKEHNIELRRLAIEKGYKINEYGVFTKDTGEKIAGRSEEEVYGILGLDYIPPELRENRGEIQAAADHQLPHLIEMDHIRGDFHVHTNLSDGSASIEEVAEECKRRGYEYFAITDHSETLKVAGGLSGQDLIESMETARKINERIDGFRILTGAEVEILSDGRLDYPDSILKDLDIVVAAVHSGFKMSKKEMTERILTAMANDYVTILAHPTGRVIEQRDPYEVDLERIIDEAKGKGVWLEINALPERLDLNDVNAKWAKENGVMMAIGTDAHSLDQLDYMTFGVATARRGWLEKGNVANTLGLKDLERTLGI